MVLYLKPQDLKPFIKQVIEIDRAQLVSPWCEKDWMTLTDSQIFLAVESQEVIGLAVFKVCDAGELWHLLKIAVKNSFLGKGHGKIILKQASEYAKTQAVSSFYLEVSTENQIAIRLYESFGFKVLTTKKKFYSSGEDAFAMQLSL